MNRFESISPSQIDRILDRIGKDWMLITAEANGKANTMTASWGCMGILWNKPVAICFIRPSRHTYTLAEEAEHLSLSFFADESSRAALRYCGTHSGRDGDKFAAAGLTLAHTEDGIPYPSEASLVLCCRKLYADDLKEASFLDPALLPANYPTGDLHRVYICAIEAVYQR